jgi:hypothetical protein
MGILCAVCLYGLSALHYIFVSDAIEDSRDLLLYLRYLRFGWLCS